MNKEGMVEVLSERMSLTKKDAELVIASVFDIITGVLSSGENVKIVGFGSFEVKNRAPRVGRNPRNNVPVNIPARKMPVFKPGKMLKKAVSESRSLSGYPNKTKEVSR